MDNTFVRPNARRRKRHANARPFRTAIRAMTIGSLLLAMVALLHEESPVARLVAERGASPSSLVSQTVVANESGASAGGPAARPVKNSARFWNAAHSATQSDHGPTIQLGPLLGGSNGTHQPIDGASVDQAPLVTRSYRPVSMSAVSLQRFVRPLLTARGEAIAANSQLSPQSDAPQVAERSRPSTDGMSADQSGVLIVSDRPEAIGRIDALCRQLDSTSPRIAIDLVVLSVWPNAGRQLPWDQWRNSFGIVESELPAVLNQISGLGHATPLVSNQLQTISGTWTELEWGEQTLASQSSADSAESMERDTAAPSANTAANPAASAITKLRVRPTSQSEEAIRIEVRAQSSRLENRARPERPQLVTVRFNTEVVLREGATGVINLFVDEPFSTQPAPATTTDSTAAARVSIRGPHPPAKIIAQPLGREQTLLLLMPRIAGPPHAIGKLAASKPRDPA